MQVRTVATGVFDVHFQNSGGPYIVQATAFLDIGPSPGQCAHSTVSVERVQTDIFRYRVNDSGNNYRDSLFAVTLF